MDSPFDPSRITASWEPLDWQAPRALSDPEAQRYVRYYGIDFASRYPDLLHAFGYFEAAGHLIAVHAWMPPTPRGTVLVCHGYFDHVGLYRHVIDHLLRRGFAVLAYDLPGHGLSSGPRAVIDDFRIYREVLLNCLEKKANHLPKPWHVVAQSTGGAIVIDLALYGVRAGIPFPFEKVVLLAPLVRPAGWRLGALKHALVSPFTDAVKRVFPVNSGDPEFLHFLRHLDPLQSRQLSARWVGALKKWIPTVEGGPRVSISPVVIQGDLDTTVDWRHNLDVIEDKFASPDIHILKGARHQLVNEAAPYRERIARILDSHLT